MSFKDDIEQRLQSYNWNEVFYDPLHDSIEASTDEDKQDLAVMEQLIEDLQHLAQKSPEQAKILMEKYWTGKPMESWMQIIVVKDVRQQNFDSLEAQVSRMGFGALRDQLRYYERMKIDDFVLYHREQHGSDTMRYLLQFEKDDEKISFVSYDATLRGEIQVPDKIIGSMNARELDQRMAQIDWQYDRHMETIVEAMIKTPEGEREIAFINETLRDFDSLFQTQEGKEIAALLSFKHWSDGFYSRFVIDLPQLSALYEKTFNVHMSNAEPITKDEVYQMLKVMKQDELNHAVLLNAGLEKEHVIANEVVNKAERESLMGSKFIAYNTDAYFLSSRQVHFFGDSQSANRFILDHPTKAYKLIEYDSVQDMLKKIPYGSIVAEQQESYLSTKEIAEQVLESVKAAMTNGEHWMACDQSLQLSEGVYFFRTKDDAIQFSQDNVSDRDQFQVKYVPSVEDFVTLMQLKKYFSDNLNLKTMNEQNMQYLKDNIKYMGFGEGLAAELEKQLQAGKADFQLQFKGEMNKKPFEATLNFRKSDNTDMYFFNSYSAKLERSNGEVKEQTFYLDKGKGITAKEAFNLLEGRSVYKDLTNKNNEPYKAWLQLDFSAKDKHQNHEVKQYHENYGYDVRAAVGKLAVSELGDPEKEKSLIQSLQKGNVQSVSIDKDGSSVKMFIEANPQFKTVNVYDNSMKRVQREDLVQYQSKQLVKEPQQSLENTQKKTAVKKVAKSTDSLIPKKRTSQKKGLGIS